MPELFPGGKVGFPEHGIQMYIEEVTHTWDNVNGYQTVAQLMAPSVLNANSKAPVVSGRDQLPPNMVEALIEPLRDSPSAPTLPKKVTAPKPRPALPTTPQKKRAANEALTGTGPLNPGGTGL
jgi:hypothetical protein